LGLGLVCGVVGAARAQQPGAESYKRTLSERPYAHYLELKDAAGRPIDPDSEAPQPYSPTQTCKTCHDLEAIAHGWHFNAAAAQVGEAGAAAVASGRPGEPWWWIDKRTGTALPVSQRGWAGMWSPEAVGLDPLDMILEFGRHHPGGGATAFGRAADGRRRALTGEWAIDCMACHGAGRGWSQERWADQIAAQNLQWAPTAALGLAAIEGSAKSLPDAFDPDAEGAASQWPRTRYDPKRFDAEGRVFFDVVRRPENSSCLGCHSEHSIGGTERWLRDGDVHLRAGMSCVDCHRNGLEHHTVRGVDGEQHPQGVAVESLSCRGCHMDSGRLGAPRPEHRGLPPVHLEKLSCTACHSGPAPAEAAPGVQTARAHGLGLPDQRRSDEDLPAILQGVLRRDADGVVRPKRLAWPSFWGELRDGEVQPLAPRAITASLRRALRVRQDLREIVGEEFADTAAKIAAGLDALQKDREGTVVFVSGGAMWQRAAEGAALPIERVEHAAARAVSWDLGHAVRPARQAAGATGCAECHSEGAAFFYQTSSAVGVVADPAATAAAAWEGMGLDLPLVRAWEGAFEGRDLFKWLGLGAVGLVLLVLLLHLLFGLEAVLGWLGRRGRSTPPEGEARS